MNLIEMIMIGVWIIAFAFVIYKLTLGMVNKQFDLIFGSPLSEEQTLKLIDDVKGYAKAHAMTREILRERNTILGWEAFQIQGAIHEEKAELDQMQFDLFTKGA